jgi:hypothetical protein
MEYFRSAETSIGFQSAHFPGEHTDFALFARPPARCVFCMAAMTPKGIVHLQHRDIFTSSAARRFGCGSQRGRSARHRSEG